MTSAQGRPVSLPKPFGLAVSAFVHDGSGRYLLLRRSKTCIHFGNQWETPGGKIRPEEPFDVALLREVKEESGLDVILEATAGVTEFEIEKLRVVLLHMHARAVSTAVKLSDEHTDYAWLRPEDFSTKVICPKIENWRNLVLRANGRDQT